tara:strand:- start:846 stop:1301 length:456 start_codon:yes stop_codon:yes gene_type:complete
MASTISAATLTVTVTESIVLNGSNMGATNTTSLASINEINQRIVTIDAGNVRTLFNFGGTVAAGEFIRANVKYLRITNKDDTNTVSINIRGNATNCWVEVEPSGSFMLTTASSMMEADDDTTVVTPVLEDLQIISAYSASGADLDCYIALT